MNLGIKTETFAPAEDQSWLGSKHGTQEMDSITLDGDAFLATFPDGVVPSGVVVGRVTATGLYRPYAGGAADGTETARGHLFTTKKVDGLTPASLLWHGEVVRSKLPTGNGLDAAAEAELPQIRYV